MKATYPDFIWGNCPLSQLQAALQTYGCFMVRGLYPPEQIAAMRTRAELAYRAAEEQLHQGQMPRSFFKTYYKDGHLLPDALDPPDFAMMRFAVGSPLKTLLQHFFGPQVSFLRRSTLARRLSPSSPINTGVSFHQDAVYLGGAHYYINFWTPLMACGEKAPGIEVLMVGLEHQLSLETYHKANSPSAPVEYSYGSLDETRLYAEYPRYLFWHPEMQPGDMLAFTHYTIHRTYMTPTMTEPRISLELRCTHAENAAENNPHVPLVVFDLAQQEPILIQNPL